MKSVIARLRQTTPLSDGIIPIISYNHGAGRTDRIVGILKPTAHTNLMIGLELLPRPVHRRRIGRCPVFHHRRIPCTGNRLPESTHL